MIASPLAALQGRAGLGQAASSRAAAGWRGHLWEPRSREESQRGSAGRQKQGRFSPGAAERSRGAAEWSRGCGSRAGGSGGSEGRGRTGRGGAHLGRNAVPPRRAQSARLRIRVRKAARRDEQRIAVRPIESERGAAVGRDKALFLLRLLPVGLGAEPTWHRKGSEAEPRPRNVPHGRAGRSRRQTKAKRGGTEPPTATGSARWADTGSRARAGREAAASISDEGRTVAREAQTPPSARVAVGAAPAPSRCPPGAARLALRLSSFPPGLAPLRAASRRRCGEWRTDAARGRACR